MLTGQAKRDYQREYMRDYMRRRRTDVKTLLRPNVKTPLRPSVRPTFDALKAKYDVRNAHLLEMSLDNARKRANTVVFPPDNPAVRPLVDADGYPIPED